MVAGTALLLRELADVFGVALPSPNLDPTESFARRVVMGLRSLSTSW
jgi:hypothetical protein